MTTMPQTVPDVTTEEVGFLGVDTHKHTHHAAVIDALGRPIADAEFAATPTGYRQLLAWAHSHHRRICGIGIEGTGTYGTGLTRALHAAGCQIIDVDRPDRKARRAHGKSDPIDAYAAARAVASGRATAIAKQRDGDIEALRLLHTAIRQTVTARATAITELKSALVITPEPLRNELTGLTDSALLRRCNRLRCDTTNSLLKAAKTVLRTTAARINSLTTHLTALRHDRRILVRRLAPALLNQPGIGEDSTAQMLITFGDNRDRIHNEAAFAHLTGTAPIPASSGKTTRHRLDRGGDRQANRSLYIIAINRLRRDERTQAYAARRTAEGKTRRDIIRSLKRYIAREIYRLITTDPPTDTPCHL